MNGRNISEEGGGAFSREELDRAPVPEQAPVAQPEDYAAEDVEEVDFSDLELGEAERTTEATNDVGVGTSLDDPSWLRQNCLSLAVQSLGPERPDSGANWTEDTIRRSEQFLKYIKNGVRE